MSELKISYYTICKRQDNDTNFSAWQYILSG